MKGKVYRVKIGTLLDSIMAGVMEREDTLKRVARNMLVRVAKCADVDGGMFENVTRQTVPTSSLQK
jgi:hypothetical protein